ncbi:MAG: hypothetical protein ACFCUQ_10285 [Kiloniellales bacterium]
MPLEVGRIEVDDEGYLRAREGDQPLGFRFSFRGFDFDVLVESGEAGSVHLKGALGVLPFTAESDIGRRVVQRLFAAADKLNRGRLVLSERGEITIEASTVPPKPRTPISIMATVAALLLEAKPYIELLAEVLRADHSPQSNPR